MKIIDLFSRYELLSREIVEVNWLSRRVHSESDVKKEEEKIYKDNQRMLDAVQELEELTNRIFEVLATNYVEIRGTRYSLATLHHYITSEESNEFDRVCNYVDYSLCKVPALHPQYCVGKVEYLRTLDKSQWQDEMKSMMYEEAELDVNPRQEFLVDPLKLCEKTESAEFDFMSEVKNVYLKAITSVDV